jgi:hypothetical protein
MDSNYRYSDLTPDQLKRSNGCGSSFLPAAMFRLPRFLFPRISKACDCHDVGYQIPGTLEDKWAHDAQLVEDFLEWARAGGNSVVQAWRFKVAHIVWWVLDTWLSELCWRWAQR